MNFPSAFVDSPFGEDSIFNPDYFDNERNKIANNELKVLEQILGTFKYNEDDFSAGANAKGNPHENGFAHGDIEKIALTGIYNEQEIKEVYYGNWLRDYSQFLVAITVRPDETAMQQLFSKYHLNEGERKLLTHFFNVFTHDNWITLLEILATKQFIWQAYYNKDKTKLPYTDFKEYIKEFKQKFPPLTKDTLGVYRPEEHIDNPKGQKDESKYGYINFNYEYEKGKTRPTLLYKGEIATSLKINAGIINSLPDSFIDKKTGNFIYNPEGLKYYIFKDVDVDRPSSITYFRQQLKLAVDYGNTKEGRMHLGAALHVLEDYFAHTNFVEICLIKLVDEKVYPWVDYVNETHNRVSETKDKKYWQDKSKWLIKNPIGVLNERANNIPIVTGVFLEDDTVASIGPKIADEFFDLSKEPYQPRQKGERTLFDIVVLTLLNAYTKKQNAEPTVKKEFDAKFWLDIYNSWLNLLDGIAIFKEKHPILGKGLDRIKSFFSFIGFLLSYFANFIANLMLSNTGKTVKEAQSLNYGSNPTHTQIAKDPFDHPLNSLAGTLAIEAVKDVVLQVKKSISKGKLETATEQYILSKYFAHPCKVNWMDGVVNKWANEHKDKLASLQFATEFKEVEYKAKLKKVDTKGFLEKFYEITKMVKKIVFILVMLFSSISTNSQINNFDTTNLFSYYNNNQTGVAFFYPKSWKEEKVETKIKVGMGIDKVLFLTKKKAFNKHPDADTSLLYWCFDSFFDQFLSIEEGYEKEKSNEFNYFKDSFKLANNKIEVNKNGVKYYFIKSSGIHEKKFSTRYSSTFVKDSVANSRYEIELTCSRDNIEYFDKLFEFICDNFSFIDKVRPAIKKKSYKKKKTSK